MSRIKRRSVPGTEGQLKAPELAVQMALTARCLLLDRPSMANYWSNPC